MKKITLLVIMLLAVCHINAQISLTAGDIAFVGSNADGATFADDTVTFVLLKDIDALTTVIFTDRGWNDGSGFSAFAGDGEFTWTSGIVRLAGDVVTINLIPLMPAAYGTIGDQLFAIQGSIAAPIFIAGLQYNEVAGTSTDTNWDGAATTNSTSALPNALINGDTAVRLINLSSLEQDNWQFSCVLAGAPNGTPAAIRALVHNRANWNSNNSTPYNPALEVGCSFTVVTAADNTPPVITCAATPADITADITGMAAIPDLVTGTSATDDVSADINITITQSPTAGTMVGVGVHMVTLTAMDEAGNSANCMIAVTVIEPPTTSLFAGDIAFVGFNLDGSDSFAFILLKDIIAGTQIKLTDCGVSNPNTISCNGVGGEGTATWYAPAAMSAGDIVILPGSFIIGSNLSSIGDQIFAYQGTEAAPIFIAAIQSNVEAGTNDSDWDGTNTTNANSALPDQLINGVNSIRLHNSGSEIDNWQFNCSAVDPITGTPSQVAAIINDIANWINDDFTEYSPTAQSGCSFTINVSSDVNPPVITNCGPTPEDIAADVLGNATVPDLTTAVVATDDVTLAENLTITQSPAVGTSITAGVTVVTLFVSDEGGNTAMCTINVTVNNMVATPLAAGDIAFVGINQDGSDSFAFILLKGILAGTMINFTDCGVNNPNTITCIGTNDATNTWFSPTDMPAGSIVTLNASFIGSLGSIGDQLFAYQGDASAPTFIAGIHTSVVSGTNDGDWDGANTDGATSALPDQLTNGVNAIRLHSSGTEVDNWQFDCSLVPGGSPVSGTPAEVAAIINDLAYWISNDATEYSPAAKAGCVYILDVIPPVAVCKDITIQLDATGNATIVALDVDGGSTDNIGIVSYAIDKSTFTCSDVSPVTVTLTVTDAAGNPATCTALVILEDIIIPVITCPEDITQTADTGVCTAVVTLTDPTATDNCTEITFAGVRSDALEITDAYPLGETTITWTATDAAGNDSETCMQKITITDDEMPVITCEADIEQTTDDDKCDAIVTITEPTATDNCIGPVTFAGVRSDALPLTDPYPLGETSITWTATDVALNDSETCVQKITITDDQVPVITCPDDITETADADSCNAVVTITDPSATDNCTGTITYTGVRSDALELTDPYPVGETTITWTATDEALNDSETCEQKITITDDQAPVIICEADITQTADSGVCNADVIITDPSATDNCTGTITYTGVRSDALALTDPYPVGETTVTWTATDEALNDSETCVQKITITDNEAPVITCPTDIEQSTDEGFCDAFVTIIDPTATDNCTGTVIFAGLRSDGLQLNEPYPLGETTIIWIATDAEGNDSDTCMQKITITDDEAPEITCLADITQTADANSCDANVVILDPIAFDNCIGAITITGERSDDLALSDPYPIGETTITWTATDTADNDSQTCIQTITVTDDEDPTITCPADIVQTTDIDSCDAYIIYDVTSSDNCTGETITQTAGLPSGSNFPFGTTTNTFVVTDASGNTATCSFDVTISKIITTSVVTVTPDNQQYSDVVTFETTLSPGACTSGGQAASSVSFYVGSQYVGIASLNLVSDELIGTLIAPLTESPSYPSNGLMAPGFYDVKAVFGGVNPNFTVTDATTSLSITQEDALVEYTGQSLQATSSSSSSVATVVLTANIQDITVSDGINDPDPGDIRNAKVKFVNRDNNNDISGWIPVNNLINSGDNSTGTVSYNWSVDIGNNDSESTTVGIIVDNGYYLRNSSQDDTVVTVYKPDGDFITGGGHIVPTNSAGVYASIDGLKTNFGFNVKFDKKGKKLKGHMNVIFRRMEVDGVHTYQIKGNAIQSLGVNIADENNKTAVFVTKSNLKDVTDALNPVSLGGNLILKVDMTDRGEPGFEDSIAFNLTNNSNTLLYSSNWTGISTSEMLLSGGNLVVHSGFSSSDSSANREFDPIAIVSDTFEVTTWPNPSDKYFKLKLKSDNTKDRVEIHVFNAIGKLVHHEIGTSTQEFTFGKTFSIGTYMVHITQSNKQHRVRLIRK